jgi:hypothetical protein
VVKARILGPLEHVDRVFESTSVHWCMYTFCVMSSAFEICGLLGYYTASCGNCLPTFRDNVSVPSSRVKSPSGKESQQPIT